MKNRGSRNYQREVDPYDDYTNLTISSTNSKKGTDNECSKLTFETQLQNVIKTQLDKVKEKDKLPIVLNAKDVLNVYNRDGKICGIIIDTQMKKLIDCINKGNSFTALVKSKVGDTCIVQIQIV